MNVELRRKIEKKSQMYREKEEQTKGEWNTPMGTYTLWRDGSLYALRRGLLP